MESRKKNFLLVTCFLALLISPDKIAADGSIGCQFSSTLCAKEVEYCYDDNAFGRCIEQFGNIEDEDLFRYDLSGEELGLLEKEMERLFSRGYRWSHTYTQCSLQAVLYAFKTSTEYDRSICDHLKDQDLDAALKAIESDVEMQVEPQNMAYVKFTPSMGNPHADFADEVYFPPLTPEELDAALAIRPPPLLLSGGNNEDVTLDMGDDNRFIGRVREESPFAENGYAEFPYTLLRKKSDAPISLKAYRRASPSHFSPVYNTPDEFRSGHEIRDAPIETNAQPQLQYTSNHQDEPAYPRYYNDEQNDERYPSAESVFVGNPESGDAYQIPDQQPGRTSTLVGFNREYNTPDKFRLGFETKDSFPQGAAVPPENNRGLLYHLGYRMSEDPQELVDLGAPRGYTEGGMVFLPTKSNNKNEEEEEALSQLLSGLDPALGWGFKRRERLDVKKPGPLFSTNNYAFQGNKHQESKKASKHSASAHPGSNEALSKEMLQEELMGRGVMADRLYAAPEDIMAVPNKKELLHEKHAHALDSSQYDVVDTSYAYIGVEDSIREWKDGGKIVNTVARLLHLPNATFTNVRVDRNEVTFKVDPKKNLQGLNASEVAKRIDGIKDKLEKETGITVTSAGIGDKYFVAPKPELSNHTGMLNSLSLRNNRQSAAVVYAKLPTITSLVSGPDHDLYVVSFILIGVVGAVIISAAALYTIRRHAASREKLQNITAPDTEASKDYQDLCRARMATKPAQETTPAAQRIASLSRESDNSPSSRSSTSSWSEEPALTNMDISTGHMVLSYMEDHLRNKDRLEREWAALCAYEAEPCATTIAQRPENANKNRYVNALPYDHARVLLNQLSNISGTDYINASTITDHDPRNPAYIATQGPLPHTTPDLWQMVWEQGCVVMVMLTRLIENDSAMCHRYWPEEGSELYHIYEVHLVSEHIWCDDYLVRSFYLKNLKTGETRTVTQFHFLSWPDGGVPSSIKALLEFRRKVNKSFRGRSCPIVVHCSDGVGRTGTYCLLDMVLNRMAKGAKEIDIAATLEHIRDQRMGSVATKQQFQLVLAAVAEEVQAILRVLPQQQPQQQQQQQLPQQQQQQQL